MRPRTLCAGLLLAVAAAAPRATAETRDAATLSLGAQVEAADVVALALVVDESSSAAGGEHGSERVTVFRIDETLKGSAARGATVSVESDDHGVASPTAPGVPHLLFLRAVRGADGSATALEPVAGAFSVRAVAPGTPEARFPSLVGDLLEASASPDPAALRALLVAWMDDADPGVAWSGATDFVRRRDLHAGLTDAERDRIVDAFRRRPVGKETKHALALAAGAVGTPAAVRALADALVADGGLRIRESVAEALRRSGAPDAAAHLSSRLAEAGSESRRALLGALAVVGGAAEAPSVLPFLADADGDVRTDAAAALGGMARNARRTDPEARLGAAKALRSRVEGPTVADAPADELRACLWALAQLDEPEAAATLRTFAAESPRADLRGFAERLVARPRQSLVLAR